MSLISPYFRYYLLTALLFLSCAHQEKTENKETSQHSTPSIQVGKTQLNYIIEGEGIPCLVIGSSIYYPKTFSQDLKNHLKMYFVDLKWFAPDFEEKLEDMNIASIVEDVEEIRQKLGLEKPLIMGHSIHGTISTEYVKKHGDKVLGLIVIGSPTEWGNDTYNQKAEALWATASAERKQIQEDNWGSATELDRLTGQEEASARYNAMSPQYWYNPRYDAGWLWEGMTVHSEVTQHLFTTVFKGYSMFPSEDDISVPMFVGLGKYDYVIPYTLWDSTYENVKDFTLIHFEKSGHTPQLEESELFDEKLLEWLDSKAF